MFAEGLRSAEFRTPDGSGNNVANPAYGQSHTQLIRLAPSGYANGLSEPRGGGLTIPLALPSARSVSNYVAAQSQPVPSTIPINDMFWQWGQVLDHDLDLTEENGADTFNVPVIDSGDLFNPPGFIGFHRSAFVAGTGTTNPREHDNVLTHWIDASMVYGSTQARSNWKRIDLGGGQFSAELETGPHNLLPKEDDTSQCIGPLNNVGCFAAGDVRSNEQIGLTAMHTLLMREHNRLVALLRAANPAMSEDDLFERARALVAAEIQIITYAEFLPLLIGSTTIPAYSGYDASIDPSIATEFSTAAFRVGHTMLSPNLQRLEPNGSTLLNGNVALRNAFFNNALIETDGIEPVLRGLITQRAQAIDTLIIDDVRNFLFGPPGAGGLDLVSLNIQRGRDHGLASYNDTRRALNLPAATTFASITSDTSLQANLAAAYNNDVEAVDLWIGGLAENHANGAVVGETFQAILANQFTRLRDGDRFWHENIDWTTLGFASDPVLHSDASVLTNVRLSDILRWNTDVQPAHNNVFLADSLLNGTGFFASSGQTFASVNSYKVATADFNNDGNLDIIRIGASETNVVFLGNGTGIFPSGTPLADEWAYSTGVAIGDLDNDGDLDLVEIQAGVNAIWIYDNGTFTKGQTFSSIGTFAVALADTDGDGDLDIFFGNGEDGGSQLFLNNNNATFTDSGQAIEAGTTQFTVDAAFADVDGDLDPDLVVINTNGDGNWLYRNDNGTFVKTIQLGMSDSEDVAVFDANGDGDLDIYIANHNEGSDPNRRDLLWLGDGAGGFTASNQVLSNASSEAVVSADVDGDGDIDLILGNYAPTNFNTIWLNDGAGNFTDSGQQLGSGSTLSIAAGDFDNDGDVDFFEANGTYGVTQRPPDAVWLNQNFNCANVAEIPVAECNALVALYNDTNGASWVNNHHWLQTNTPCAWFGVTCENGAVTDLNLNFNRLTGTLPNQLQDLQSLKGFRVAFNDLQGSFPSQLLNIASLLWINLDANQFSGTLPANLFNKTNLQMLLLSRNNFSGTIPVEIGQLTNLLSLSLGGNNFTGSLPTTLGNLTQLVELYLAHSAFTGELPSTLVNLTNLNVFAYSNSPLCAPNNAAFTAWLNGIANLQATGLTCGATTSLTAIYMIAADNDPNSVLSINSYVPAILSDITTATDGATNKTAVILVDFDGYGDTQVYIAQNGVLTPIGGLPNNSGTLDTSIHEYDMTDGAQLGGFLRWALTNHANADTQTVLHFIGHGTFVMPDGAYPNGGNTRMTFEIGSNPGYTDIHPTKSVIAPHDIRQMLEIGTDNGNTPLHVLDLTHCFAGTLEELVELDNVDGDSYAKVITVSPSYGYIAETLFGAALNALSVGDAAVVSAENILNAYDSTLTQIENGSITHPALWTIVDSTKLSAIKPKLDTLSLILNNHFTANFASTRAAIQTAQQNSAVHDTSFEEADWALGDTDSLVDVGAFMQQLAAAFAGDIGITSATNDVKSAVEDAVLGTVRRAGIPYFGSTFWDFNAAERVGLALFAPFTAHVDAGVQHLPWQLTHYVEQPQAGYPTPYALLTRSGNTPTWATVVQTFWQGAAWQPAFGLPPLTQPEQTGEILVDQVLLPDPDAVHFGTPTSLAVRVFVAGNALYGVQTYFSVIVDGNEVYSETVTTSSLMPGFNVIETEGKWVPTSNNYALHIMGDSTNRVTESNETNNTLDTPLANIDVQSGLIITATNGTQFNSDRTVTFDLAGDAPVTYAAATLYRHSAHVNNPMIRTTTLVDDNIPVTLNGTAASFELPADEDAGAYRAVIWGFSGSVRSSNYQVVYFNYAPTNYAQTVSQTFYRYRAEAGEALTFNMNITSGNLQWYIWSPDTPNTAIMLTGSGTYAVSPTSGGDYLVMVEQTGGTPVYSLTATSDGQPARSTANTVVVQMERPMFIVTTIDIAPHRPESAVTVSSYQTTRPQSRVLWPALLLMFFTTPTIIRMRRHRQ
ncbi:MAG: peroxidase family protein [Candidatus Promineifilaceae bacterium]